MTDFERDAMRREDHSSIAQMLGMVRSLMDGQKDHARITADRQQRQDDRIDRITAELSQQNREMVRAGKETAELRGEVREMRQAFDERFDQIAHNMRNASPSVILVLVTLATTFVQFVLPTLIEKVWP